MHEGDAAMGAERYELSTWESLALLRAGTIGRLCVIEHGYPLAVPVNYRISGTRDDSKIVIRTAPDTLLGRYEGLASLEVDEILLDKGTAWSVIVRGILQHVHGGPTLPDPKPLVAQGRHQWITLATYAISGRRFVIQPSSDGFSVDWQPTPA
jgi:Pyridoxamine 5'-phosphate oxidase